MSARKSSHRTIFLIVSSGSPLALIASSLRSTSKKPVCPMTRSLHPPMAHCRQRVRFAATWREEFFEVPFIYLFYLVFTIGSGAYPPPPAWGGGWKWLPTLAGVHSGAIP